MTPNLTLDTILTLLLLLLPGGYQEARGSGIRSNHYFVENIFEELDAPGEWFHDPVGEKLYFWPNSTKPFEEVVAPVNSAIVRVQGAKDIQFQGRLTPPVVHSPSH